MQETHYTQQTDTRTAHNQDIETKRTYVVIKTHRRLAEKRNEQLLRKK